MASAFMTPGQLAYVAHEMALKEVWGLEPRMDWETTTVGHRRVMDQVADSIRKQLLGDLGISPGALVVIRDALETWDSSTAEGHEFVLIDAEAALDVIRIALNRPLKDESA